MSDADTDRAKQALGSNLFRFAGRLSPLFCTRSVAPATVNTRGHWDSIVLERQDIDVREGRAR